MDSWACVAVCGCMRGCISTEVVISLTVAILKVQCITTTLAWSFAQALGHHHATLTFQVLGGCNGGAVLAEVDVQVQGTCLGLGDKHPLPGGPEATPQTFIKPWCGFRPANAFQDL